MNGQDANRVGRNAKGESLLRDSPFRVVMRFVLHLPAALLLVHESFILSAKRAVNYSG